MMHLIVKESGTLGVLTLQGELAQNQADELKLFLRRALDYVGGIIVDCEKVTRVDPACLQIICSAYRQSQMLRKNFELAGHRQDLFRDAAKVSQYLHCVGCELESEQGCLWGLT